MARVRAACHCTAVRLLVEEPEWVLDCNCTICRRYGALWTYPRAGDVELVAEPEKTDQYLWGDRELVFHRCGECGCVTHTTPVVAPTHIFAVNARMIPTLDPKDVRVRQKDNGHTGWFWTRSEEPWEPSLHPEMDPPGPEDWR